MLCPCEAYARFVNPTLLCSVAVEPLTSLRSSIVIRNLASAINELPFTFAALLHVSAFQIFTPYLVALGAKPTSSGAPWPICTAKAQLLEAGM